MSSRIFGYSRLSSKDQNEARQLKKFRDYSMYDRDIYIDKKSGKDFNREGYQSLKSASERYLGFIKSMPSLLTFLELIIKNLPVPLFVMVNSAPDNTFPFWSFL